MVVLGPPGSGKSTLLRHYELDCAHAALAGQAGDDLSQAPLTFFVSLYDYKPASANASLPLAPGLARGAVGRTLPRPARARCPAAAAAPDPAPRRPERDPRGRGGARAAVERISASARTRLIRAIGRCSPAAIWITASPCRPKSSPCRRCVSSPCLMRRCRSLSPSTARNMGRRCGRTSRAPRN